MQAYATPCDESFENVTLMSWDRRKPVGVIIGFAVDQGRHFVLVLWSSSGMPHRLMWHHNNSVQRLPAWQ